MNNARIITQCQSWLSDFIVKHSICPFARPVVESQGLEWQLIEAEELEEQLMTIMGYVQHLLSEDEPETMLLILPALQHQWLNFLTLIDCANQLLEEHELLSDIQIASFHPDYLFEGEAPESSSHFTNRSPWPVVHLIRQASISRALETFSDPESIPQRNINLMEQLGVDQLQQQLADFQRQVNN